ncbi:uncharacterized protein METZ01_LOCUS251457, partial [marine metagenome]
MALFIEISILIGLLHLKRLVQTLKLTVVI